MGACDNRHGSTLDQTLEETGVINRETESERTVRRLSNFSPGEFVDVTARKTLLQAGGTEGDQIKFETVRERVSRYQKCGSYSWYS